MITATQSFVSNIANTSTGKLTDTPLGPPRGMFSGDGLPTPRPTFGYNPTPPRPTNFANPRPFSPIAIPIIANTAINAVPKINDDGLTVSIVPNIFNDTPTPRGVTAGILPPKGVVGLEPIRAQVLANSPIPTNIPIAGPPIFKTTVTDELGKPIENANLYLDGVAVGLTNKNGFVQKIGYNALSVVKISFVGFQPYEGLASQLPSKVVLKTGEQLNEVVIRNREKKGFPWLYAILIGGGLYLGYKAMNKSGAIKASI